MHKVTGLRIQLNGLLRDGGLPRGLQELLKDSSTKIYRGAEVFDEPNQKRGVQFPPDVLNRGANLHQPAQSPGG